jgi:hypothetical protein
LSTKETLSVTGYHDEPVPNRFFRQEGETDHLAVVLPGLGYNAEMPLLHYPGHLLLQHGMDVLVVDYDYSHNPAFRAASESDRIQWLLEDVTAAWDAVVSRRQYMRHTLLGKSLGTLAMGQLLLAKPVLSRAETIWLTPLLGERRLVEVMRQHRGRSLIAIGTADPAYVADALTTIQTETGAETIVVEGADHGLELPGDALGSLHVVERVARGVDAFLVA